MYTYPKTKQQKPLKKGITPKFQLSTSIDFEGGSISFREDICASKECSNPQYFFRFFGTSMPLQSTNGTWKLLKHGSLNIKRL